jgi:hypothetical protein
MADLLEALAARAESDPFFLAAYLAAFACSERLDDAGLAGALGCRPGDLPMLRLCRAPRSSHDEFWDDVTTIAAPYGIEPERLAEAVKRGRVVLTLAEADRPGGGLLMAARDREEEAPPDPSREAP